MGKKDKKDKKDKKAKVPLSRYVSIM